MSKKTKKKKREKFFHSLIIMSGTIVVFFVLLIISRLSSLIFTGRSPSVSPSYTVRLLDKKEIEEASANLQYPEILDEEESKYEVGPSVEGEYFLQVGSFINKEKAYQMSSFLNKKGYNTFVIKAEVSGKGILYRVRMGGYSTLDETKRIASILKKKFNLSPIVVHP